MKLKAFRVRNYRSINDSGWIEVRQRTALVGRNESGKTNLLLALQSLNAPGRRVLPLTFVKDFPRDRRRDEFSKNLPTVHTKWKLTGAEQTQLAGIFPRAKKVTTVTVSRRYGDKRYIGFQGLPEPSVDHEKLDSLLAKTQRSINASFASKGAATTQKVKSALKKLGLAVREAGDPYEWARQAAQGVETFKKEAAAANYSLPDGARTAFGHVENLVQAIAKDREAVVQARKWVVQNLPVFIYLEEYPQLNGHQDVLAYLERQEDEERKESDQFFEKLMKVADLDPEELQGLLSAEHEERQLLTNRAGSLVTGEVRRLWKDRKLTVRFNLDERHFDTLVSDPTSHYPVEVNLDERSRGFKWFFSFYITFAADTAGGPAENAVLLLDEPGLHLHMVAQRDLLDHFKDDFKNTIIYTTHSAFMIPVDDIPSIRTVNISSTEGTTVTNDPTGDAQTLSPIQTALGYDLTQTLFIGERNLVVEGVSDYWYLSSISDHLAAEGGTSLPTGLVISPAGGAQKVSYMVALQTAHRLRVLVLLDAETQAKRTARKDLIKTKLIREDYVIFANEAFGPGGPEEADTEDLLDPDVYDQLVSDSYVKELKGKQLNLNPDIPRIVRRYEQAFEDQGLAFNKTRPARLFLRRIAEDPAQVLPGPSRARFERLLEIVDERLEKLLRRDREPFK